MDAQQQQQRQLRAFALFALGLCKAELGDWRGARREWRACLRGFEGGGRGAGIGVWGLRVGRGGFGDGEGEGDGVMGMGAGLGPEGQVWVLERTRVEWNWRMALFETGSRRQGIRPLGMKARRSGLNGVPAGICFGPPEGWARVEVEVERVERGLFGPLEEIGRAVERRGEGRLGVGNGGFGERRDDVRSERDSPLMKSLPPTPWLPLRVRKGAAARESEDWGEDSPTVGNDMIMEKSPSPTYQPSSPTYSAARPPSSVYDDKSSIGTQKNVNFRPPTSAKSEIPSNLSFYFSDGIEHDGEDEGSVGGFSNIDDALALWDLPGKHPALACDDDQEEPLDVDFERGTRDTRFSNFITGDRSNQTFVENVSLTAPAHLSHDDDLSGEILLPKVFEGFGPRM